MRVVAAVALIAHAITPLRAGAPLYVLAIEIVAIVAGMLLLLGFWTPIAGGLMALLEVRTTISKPVDVWFHILLATLGIALAIIGPGAWSVDARLFGWKRIDFQEKRSSHLPH
jgi:uncharacterized membrane protein YphA (DoxX/SURF4 family)